MAASQSVEYVTCAAHAVFLTLAALLRDLPNGPYTMPLFLVVAFGYLAVVVTVSRLRRIKLRFRYERGTWLTIGAFGLGAVGVYLAVHRFAERTGMALPDTTTAVVVSGYLFLSLVAINAVLRRSGLTRASRELR